MNIKTMLITSLAILRIESLLVEPTKEHDLIRKVLAEARLPEYADEQDERLVLVEIKDIITPIIEGHVTYNHTQVMRRIKLATTQVRPLYDSIVKFFNDEEHAPEDKDELEKYYGTLINTYYYQLRQALQAIQLKQHAGKLIGVINGTESKATMESAVKELQQSLGNYGTGAHTKIPSLVSSVSTKEPAAFKEIFASISKKTSGDGLVTGWQDINAMFGCNGGITEELWLMPALPFNCKSLFSLLTSLSIPVFNPAEKVMANIKGRGDKQPIILDLSFENELDVNIGYGYQAVYGYFEGKKPELTVDKDAPDEFKERAYTEMANYICSKLQCNGWEYVFQRHTNTDFKVHYLNDLILDMNRKGFHVAGIRADYFGTINKSGLGDGIVGNDVKEVYRIARNIQVGRNRGFILAPHQISPEGKRLKAIDPSSFIKQLPGRGLYQSTTSLDNEADGEMFANKRQQGGVEFLELQRGKHRTIIDTPTKHHYCVMPFQEVGILPWDYGKEQKHSASSINVFTGGLGDDIF